MPRRARTQQIEVAGRDQERILAPLLVIKELVEEPLAHAQRRHDDLGRAGEADDLLHHQRPVGEQRPSGSGNGFDRVERVGLHPLDQPGEVDGIARRNDVVVHHMQRIAALLHVQPRQRPPRAADGVEGAPAHGLDLRQPVQCLAHQLRGLLHAAARAVLQRQTTERHGRSRTEPVSLDLDHLERPAAEVAHDAVRLPDPGDHPEGRQLGLALARDQLDRLARHMLAARQEFGPVCRITGGRGGQDPDLADLHGVAQHAEPRQRRQRLVDGVGRQPPGAEHVAAQPAQHLLIEDRRRGAHQSLIGDQADRVRADIDDGNGFADLEATLCVLGHVAERPLCCNPVRIWRTTSRPASSAPPASSGSSSSATCRAPTGSDWS